MEVFIVIDTNDHMDPIKGVYDSLLAAKKDFWNGEDWQEINDMSLIDFIVNLDMELDYQLFRCDVYSEKDIDGPVLNDLIDQSEPTLSSKIKML